MKAPRRFCTLFDVHYAARAVALHHSLAATHPDVEIWIFCMDDDALELIRGLHLDGGHPVSLADLERYDPELAAVKPTRSRVEYLWTSTPAICLYCLEGPPDVHEITYLDADLWFFADSSPLFEEMGDASVLITPHRFAPERF